jgi:hypothetical protein
MRLIAHGFIVNLVDTDSLKKFIESGVQANSGVFAMSSKEIDADVDAALSLRTVVKSPTPYV